MSNAFDQPTANAKDLGRILNSWRRLQLVALASLSLAFAVKFGGTEFEGFLTWELVFPFCRDTYFVVEK